MHIGLTLIFIISLVYAPRYYDPHGVNFSYFSFYVRTIYTHACTHIHTSTYIHVYKIRFFILYMYKHMEAHMNRDLTDKFMFPGSAFIKPDQRNPWIKDQIKITLLPTISHLLLPNFVSCGRACPSHMTQNLVTVGAKLWTADRFIVDPWSMDYADPVW